MFPEPLRGLESTSLGLLEPLGGSESTCLGLLEPLGVLRKYLSRASRAARSFECESGSLLEPARGSSRFVPRCLRSVDALGSPTVGVLRRIDALGSPTVDDRRERRRSWIADGSPPRSAVGRRTSTAHDQRRGLVSSSPRRAMRRARITSAAFVRPRRAVISAMGPSSGAQSARSRASAKRVAARSSSES